MSTPAALSIHNAQGHAAHGCQRPPTCIQVAQVQLPHVAAVPPKPGSQHLGRRQVFVEADAPAPKG